MSASEAIAREPGLTLADFTGPGLIVPYLRGQDAAAVIQELSAALQREGRVTDLLQFYHSALNREYLCGTVADPGWAMPHALVKGLTEPCFALGRWMSPVVWTKRDRRQVSCVFLFAIPETDARAYMNLIYGLARLSKVPELVEQLRQASDTFEILNVLKQGKLRAVQPTSA
jgi:mannitol/fructose-specific phosphotransferase system IIA component (Ntr-type)